MFDPQLLHLYNGNDVLLPGLGVGKGFPENLGFLPCGWFAQMTQVIHLHEYLTSLPRAGADRVLDGAGWGAADV